jgi:hypothetical protein
MRRLSWGKLRPKRKPTIPLSKQNPRVPVWGRVKNRIRMARPKIKSVRSISSIVADLASLFLDGFHLEYRRRAEGNSNARIELDTPEDLAWSGKLESNKHPPFW